ncbi:MAG: L-aspartate oxidase [Bacillota bacterium]
MFPRFLINFNLQELDKVETDFLIIGSGIAGFAAAIKAAARGKVLILTKKGVSDASTTKAQGGIAAAVGNGDSPMLHLNDTIKAGAGLCDQEAVQVLVSEGCQLVRELYESDVAFDRLGEQLLLAREGAHCMHRVLRAGGDATGRIIHQALLEQVAQHENITMLDHMLAIDLLTDGSICYGVLAQNQRDGKLMAFLAPATMLSTGGAGQLFAFTTNPEIATGDGIAMAYRAGAELADLEFIQFHPTALYHEQFPAFLISEAVRGEGGKLLNSGEQAFMDSYHPEGDLAPRDVVARGIFAEMRKSGKKHVYLDVRHLVDFNHRFPTISNILDQAGIDPASQLIPVAPAAHYSMGGVKTDLKGMTSINGLYAAGEVACTGVHGANRLASNSLLEGLVFGCRVADAASAYRKNTLQRIKRIKPMLSNTQQIESRETGKIRTLREQLRRLMQDEMGIIRNHSGLKRAQAQLMSMLPCLSWHMPDRENVEMQNMITVALLSVKAALERKESRGAHFREDFPAPVEGWQKHLIVRNSPPVGEVALWS